MVARDRPSCKGISNSHFTQRQRLTVDHNAGALDGMGIGFAGLRTESADEVDMGSRTNVVAIEKRSRA